MAPDTTPEFDVTFGRNDVQVRNVRHKPKVDATIPLATLPKAKKTGHFWSVPHSDASAACDYARKNGLSIDPAVAAYADSAWVRELDALTQSNAVKLPANVEPEKIVGMKATLLETQEVAVHMATNAWLLNPGNPKRAGHRALLVADEPGLGKTLLSLASLRVEGEESAKTVVVCPTSLTANWSAEMVTHFEMGTFTPWIATGQTPTYPPGEVDTIIIGWEILSFWASTLVRWGPDALIVDEGHYAKSGKQVKRKVKEPVISEDGRPVLDSRGQVMTQTVEKVVGGSARASAALELAATVEKRHGLILGLTGTPIVNRPVELAPLLELIGILGLWGGKSRYQMRHCGPKMKNIGRGRKALDFSGASNLLELNMRLRSSGHYVRRTKQVLIDAGIMKAKYVDKVFTFDYTTRPRPWLIRATEQEMADYRACEQENATFFQGRAQELAQELGAGVTSQKVRQKIEAEGSSSKHLQRIIQLRQEAAKVKVPYIIAQANALIERGEKVVICAHHKEIVDAYADAFTGLKIQGAMGTKNIEEAKRLFNETPVSEHPVLVLSVEAGKTGHTLCKQTLHGVGPACAYMIFAEQIWTPGDEAQAQDRIWRIGQDREVRISNAVLAGTIDEDMFWQRAKKRRIVNTAIDAVEEPTKLNDTDAEKQGARQIVAKLTYGPAGGRLTA